MLRRARLTASTVLAISMLALTATACGAILGLEDAVDLRDAAVGLDSGGVVIPDDAPPCSATCAVSVPGWDGPHAFGEALGGPPSAAAPECAAPFTRGAYDGFASLVADAPTCGACTCGEPTGVTCPPLVLNLFSDGNCKTGCGNPQVIGTACTNILPGNCPGGFKVAVSEPVPTAGTCDPVPATNTVPPAAWSSTLRLCGLVAPILQKCEVGKVCVPSPTLPQKPATLCVAKPGDLACPDAYPTKTLGYASYADDRGCSACTCGNAHGASCSEGAGLMYDGPSCTAMSHPLVSPMACTNQNPKSAIVQTQVALVTAGTCDQAGGAAKGSATPTTPTTICCTP